MQYLIDPVNIFIGLVGLACLASGARQYLKEGRS